MVGLLFALEAAVAWVLCEPRVCAGAARCVVALRGAGRRVVVVARVEGARRAVGILLF